jgi:hypothetical protein
VSSLNALASELQAIDAAMLGHANIKTTDTCLNVTKPGLHGSMRRFDESWSPLQAKGPSTHRNLATSMRPPPVTYW